jgi:hypothetical protein
MAENGASTNGHRPARRRKHIYPPLEQMAAEQAASAQRRLSDAREAPAAVRDIAPDVAAPPAAGVSNGARAPRRRKRIYPPAEQMAAQQAAARPRRRSAEPATMAMTPVGDSALTADAGDGELDADRVELRLSAVGMVDAGDVQFAQGALGAARADSVSVAQGALGAALADNVQVSQGYARSIVARQVQLDNAAARMVVAADVKVQRSAIMVLIARRVSGDVRVLVDWRGAIAFGAVAGIIGGVLARARRR